MSYMAIGMEKPHVPYIRVLIAFSRVMVNLDIFKDRHATLWMVNEISAHSITFSLCLHFWKGGVTRKDTMWYSRRKSTLETMEVSDATAHYMPG